jgi:ATP-dependent Lon protease
MVIIPEENEKDLVDIPKAILKKLDIHPVSTIDQVLELALTEMPKPLPPPVEVKKGADPKGAETVITH